MNTYTLPTTLDFAPTFKRVLQMVVETGYSMIDAGLPEDIRDSYDNDKESFDSDLANALSVAMGVLGIGDVVGAEPGDWLGELYDLAEELGYSWYDDGETDDDPA